MFSQIKNLDAKVVIRHTLLNNQILGSVLIFLYCAIYGITAQIVLAGFQLLFFLASLMFAVSTYYVRDPQIKKSQIKQGIVLNQLFGMLLVAAYILVFGISSIALLSGFQLVFFMSSYVFAMSLFYIRDPERIEEENVSSSVTSAYIEKNPCFIDNQDLSWLVRELNGSLTSIIGFSELMLRKSYSDHEKEFMLRNIYEKALSMSISVNKAASITPDSLVKPKEIYEVVDLLSDKNFK